MISHRNGAIAIYADLTVAIGSREIRVEADGDDVHVRFADIGSLLAFTRSSFRRASVFAGMLGQAVRVTLGGRTIAMSALDAHSRTGKLLGFEGLVIRWFDLAKAAVLPAVTER